MSGAAFLRFKKLRGSGKLACAARHNRRTIQAEVGASGSIDPRRSHLNETLIGPAHANDVAALAEHHQMTAGISKLRKDAVRAIEAVFSLPQNHTISDKDYFLACTEWAADRFGGHQNILSSDIHRDEAAPHCHVLILPLVKGRMIGSDLVGNKAALQAHFESFFNVVCRRFGLTKAPRLSGPARQTAAAYLLAHIKRIEDAVLRSSLWPTIREVLERDPGPHLASLGLEPPAPPKRLRTMAQIFTSKGKGPSTERSPIGFEQPAEDRSLCSVGFAPPPRPALAHPIAPPDPSADRTEATVGAEDFERVRESDQSPDWFDPETGEFVAPPTNNRRKTKAPHL
ncbi:plasmid recombination protein [Inhella proteolytica]|uniref:Plasmid recombination protein n=1 Tax=Inhella proteolytica TaxID=2795029 RepID=A0A931J3T2_9BURK|nr:plasmid recombination protein [Inhella proteolytica]MBH9577766.1 plasmid recombination protein [Inhella proteolytica]